MNLFELFLLFDEFIVVHLNLVNLVQHQVEDALEGRRAHAQTLVLVFFNQVLEHFCNLLNGRVLFATHLIICIEAFNKVSRVFLHGGAHVSIGEKRGRQLASRVFHDERTARISIEVNRFIEKGCRLCLELELVRLVTFINDIRKLGQCHQACTVLSNKHLATWHDINEKIEKLVIGVHARVVFNI